MSSLVFIPAWNEEASVAQVIADVRKHMPDVDVILIEVPDEVGGYGAKGVGEIGCVATAGAVAGALHSYDGIRRVKLPMDDAPAAKPILPKSRNRRRQLPTSLETLR